MQKRRRSSTSRGRREKGPCFKLRTLELTGCTLLMYVGFVIKPEHHAIALSFWQPLCQAACSFYARG